MIHVTRIAWIRTIIQWSKSWTLKDWVLEGFVKSIIMPIVPKQCQPQVLIFFQITWMVSISFVTKQYSRRMNTLTPTTCSSSPLRKCYSCRVTGLQQPNLWFFLKTWNPFSANFAIGKQTCTCNITFLVKVAHTASLLPN